MEVKLIRKFKGHSGSNVYLMSAEDKIFVRKQFNVERNYERLTVLQNYVRVPKILMFSKGDEILDMEYIHGQDMRSYLLTNSPNRLIDFLIDSIKKFSRNTTWKEYTQTYNEMLSWMDIRTHPFPFSKADLIARLPRNAFRTVYHGDMTLENILYSQEQQQFVFIDPVTVKYDSALFDLAKLRQDLDCKWFLREKSSYLDNKLAKIKNSLFEELKTSPDDNLLILMLLRVFLHCEEESREYHFVVKEINRLWKK